MSESGFISSMDSSQGRGINKEESLNDNNRNDDFYDHGEEDGHDEDTPSDEEKFDLSACIT